MYSVVMFQLSVVEKSVTGVICLIGMGDKMILQPSYLHLEYCDIVRLPLY